MGPTSEEQRKTIPRKESPHISLLRSVDVLVDILSYLDVQSLTRLSWASKALYNMITHTRVVWVIALRQLVAAESLAPNSFPLESMSTAQLRLAASRPHRLGRAISENQTPELTAYKFKLKYPDWECEPLSERISIPLPGGRWLLTTGTDGRHEFLYCWDMSAATSKANIVTLDPAAYVAGSGLRHFPPNDTSPKMDMQLQSDPSGRRVTILLTYAALCLGKKEYLYEIFQLLWPEEEGPPTFIRRSAVYRPRSIHWNPRNIGGWHFEHCLEDQFVCMGTSGNAVIWNWKENTWAVIDCIEQGWGVGVDFIDCSWWLQGSYCWAMPRRYPKEIHRFTIPPLELSTFPPVLKVVKIETVRLDFAEKIEDATHYDILRVYPRDLSNWNPRSDTSRICSLEFMVHDRYWLAVLDFPSQNMGFPKVVHTEVNPRPSHWERPYLLSPDFIIFSCPQLSCERGQLLIEASPFPSAKSNGHGTISLRTALHKSEGEVWRMMETLDSASGHIVVFDSSGGDESVHALVCFE